ncbi:hypothetical protein M422DRAFT_261798 [Sphaerobolus stellatus SS14]|uniref:Uncharacterized protein n=1 Tax=Sphaerobolus stellatus (strain SS14) TaxID=990650 RepID=A0A0C9V2I8_SPHS4|nr:hypothetical protein M422DRAFT_261798 [Sphaerobolus stellatus SS14]
MAVLALFANTVSHPYMRRIRGPEQESTNALDLGPLHSEILSFMQRIIQDPSIILGEKVTQQSSSFDKKLWDRPEVFYAIEKHKKDLPHLKELLVAFFTGAAETWMRFTSEFETGSVIDKLSPERRLQAWMLSTNDINEGALGRYRVALRRAPNMTEETYNASTMSKMNRTLEWMEENCTPEAEYNAEVVRKKKDQDAIRKMKKDAVTAKILQVIPIKTIKELGEKNPINSELDLQLDWYRQAPGHSIPKKNALGKKTLKIEALKLGIQHFQAQGFFNPSNGEVPDFSMVQNEAAVLTNVQISQYPTYCNYDIKRQETPATDSPEHQSHSQSPAGAQSPGKAAVPPELTALDITDDITKKKPDPFLGFYFDVYRGVREVESSRSIQHVVAIKSIPTRFDPRSKRQECEEFEAVGIRPASALVDELGDPRLADPGLLCVFGKGPLADSGSNAEYR